jgi:hypothetical protein
MKSSVLSVSLALMTATSAFADVIATSNFNVPPYASGIPVDGQGGSEPGWAAPWQKLGGFADRGHVVTSPTQEGTGAVQLFADQIFGTSVERHWSPIAPAVRVDAYVYVTPGASMDGQIVTLTDAAGEIDPRRAGTWRVNANGTISVFDGTVNGYVATGFSTPTNQWNKYSLVADTTTNTYSFLFNDVPFNAGHTLPFMNSMSYVDGINLRALQTLTSYVDNVTVTSVPEPTGIVLAALPGLVLLWLANSCKHVRRRLT